MANNRFEICWSNYSTDYIDQQIEFQIPPHKPANATVKRFFIVAASGRFSIIASTNCASVDIFNDHSSAVVTTHISFITLSIIRHFKDVTAIGYSYFYYIRSNYSTSFPSSLKQQSICMTSYKNIISPEIFYMAHLLEDIDVISLMIESTAKTKLLRLQHQRLLYIGSYLDEKTCFKGQGLLR